MKRSEIEHVVENILMTIAPEADLVTLDPKEKLRDSLDIDSFDFLNLIIAVSEQLGVEIPEADYGDLTTLDEILDYILAKT